MAFEYYDIQGAAAGQGQARTPEEQQLQKIRGMIKAAEETNYDGDPQYYSQIKALAMQSGIPIKQFKTNPYRVAKAGLMSMADTMSFGMVPNSMYTPMNEAEQLASNIGGVAGLVTPMGLPGALGRGAIGGMQAMPRWARGAANKMMGQSAYKKASQGYGGMGGFFGGGKSGSRMMNTPKVPGPSPPLSTKVKGARNPKPKAGPESWKPKGSDAIMNKVLQNAANQGKKGVKIPKGLKNPKPKAKPQKPLKTSGNQTSINLKNKAEKISPKKATNRANKIVPKKGEPIVIKLNPGGAASASERAKIHSLMKPKARRQYDKLKGASKAKFLENWLKQKNIKVIYGL